MPLTPLDIYNKEFKRSFRGYNEDEVNEFLDQVVHDYEAVIRQCEELKETAAGLKERLNQYQALEETLKNTLVVAQSTAEEVKAAAQRQAEVILQEAEMKRKAMIAEAEAEVAALHQQYQTLRREMERFRAVVRGQLQAQLALLDEPMVRLAEPVAE
ncbi:MAG: DivIVA domain-containing protein [Firmicutes bacterium]|nr:DivIVA domain-containing protein [Alicyclobacillaceae bacterium]MCL6497746.1 DivIVA domain-containing protein [Bacillota bacterium]